VASMRLGGDVDGMETQTQDWVKELFSKSHRLRCKMVCHRIVLNTVARDLSTFSWCKVLLSCIADVVEGVFYPSLVRNSNSASVSCLAGVQSRYIALRY
jgi:hypothetical protein